MNGSPAPIEVDSTVTDTLVPAAHPEIVVTDNVGGSNASDTTGTAVPGDAITYTIAVTNAGPPSETDGDSITDILPGTLSGATYTATETGGASGFTASGSGNIDDTDINMPAGSTVTYTLTANIASSATGTLPNSVSAQFPNGGVSADDTDTLAPQADLEIINSDNLGGSGATGTTGTAVPGKAITYTILVTNDGPSDVTGASIADSLPATLSGATFTAAATGGASGFSASGSGSIDDTDVDLPVGSTVTYTLTANIASSATGTLSNTATVTPPGEDSDEGDDNSAIFIEDGESASSTSSATDSDTLAPEADLEITKTDNLGGSSASGAIGTAVPGEGITYTIAVTNDGPSDVTGATIADTLPSTLSGATFTAAETGGASGFSASGSGSIDDTDVDLPAGSTVTYTLTANIASSATGTLSNTATVTPPVGVTDTNGQDFDDEVIDLDADDNTEVESSSATDTDTLAPEADLEIINSDNLGGSGATGTIGTAVPGDAISYTVVVTNDGPSDVTGATIADSLPATLSGATFTAAATGGASGFTASGSGSIDDTTVDLPAGSSVTYTLTANIAPSATGTLSNTATVTPPAGVTNTNGQDFGDEVIDLDADDNTEVESSSDTDTDTLVPQSDLEITKSDNLGGSSATGAIGTAVPGQGITYTIVVTNAGPSDATGASIVDPLPSTLTGATYTAVATAGASGFSATGTGSIDDTNVDLPAGGTITYTLKANITSGASGKLSNTATVTPPGGDVISDNAIDGDTSPDDSASGNVSATDTDTLAPQVDLAITKSDNLGGSSTTGAIGTAVPGQAVTYTIVVSNDGPSNASRVSIVDLLPSTLVGATFTAVGRGGGSNFTTIGTGNIDDADVSLPVGASITYTLHALVAPSATGTISNTASATVPKGTAGTGNATATDSDTVTPQAELEITKTDNLGGSSVSSAIGTAVPGRGIIYTIVVSNAGPSDVTGAAVHDTLPSTLSGATFTAVATGGATWLRGQRQRQHRRQRRRPAGRQHGDVYRAGHGRLVGQRYVVEHGHGDGARWGDRDRSGKRHRHRHRYARAAGRTGNHQDRQSGRIER